MMQQTEKYKLNLIERSDPFLPDALNENTKRLETVVSEHLEGMDARVTVLEAKQFAYGSFRVPAMGAAVDVPLPFTPTAVLVVESEFNSWLGVKGAENSVGPRLRENGFQAQGLETGVIYTYIAFA